MAVDPEAIETVLVGMDEKYVGTRSAIIACHESLSAQEPLGLSMQYSSLSGSAIDCVLHRDQPSAGSLLNRFVNLLLEGAY